MNDRHHTEAPYGTTARDRPYVARNRLQSVNATEYYRYDIALGRGATPEVKLLTMILCSMVDPSSKTGVINPPVNRLLALTGWNEWTLAEAVKGMEATGQWTVERDSRGRPVNYLPVFYSELESLKADLKKNVLGAKDQVTWLARYGGLAGMTTIQRVAFAMAISTIRSVYQPMKGKNDPIKHRSPGRGKLVQIALFDHPLLRARNQNAYDTVAAMESIPEDYDELFATVPLRWLAAKTATDESTLIEHLNRSQSMFRVQISGRSVRITPTAIFHQAAWDFYRRPAGGERTAWEEAHGLFPPPEPTTVSSRLQDAHGARPPLGFHWIYELVEVNPDGSETVLLVGETTQSLESRRQQHLREPTNNDAHRHIEQMIRDGRAPQMRIVSLVHHYYTAVEEVARMELRLRQVVHLKNYISTVRENERTVHLDSRFDGYPSELIKAHLDYWSQHEPPSGMATPWIPEFAPGHDRR